MSSSNKTAVKNPYEFTIGGERAITRHSENAVRALSHVFEGRPYRGTAGVKWDPTAVAGALRRSAGQRLRDTSYSSPTRSCENTNARRRRCFSRRRQCDTDLYPAPTSAIATSKLGGRYTRFLSWRRRQLAGRCAVDHHPRRRRGRASSDAFIEFHSCMAKQGGGQYSAASDVVTLVKALTDISTVSVVNSVFRIGQPAHRGQCRREATRTTVRRRLPSERVGGSAMGATSSIPNAL